MINKSKLFIQEKKTMFKNITRSVLFCLIFFLPGKEAVAENIIYLTRHAEKQVDGTKDPALTEQGNRRANFLANLLRGEAISHIFSSNYKRTLQTAKPSANLVKLEIEQYNPGKQEEFSKLLKQLKGVILVVGHSNTIPDLVSLLGGDPQGEIKDSEYDRLYKITTDSKGVHSQLLRINLEKK